MEKLKGGIAMNRIRFHWPVVDVFNIAVDHRRLSIRLSGNTLRDSRFADNMAILARLESMFTEVEFMVNVGPCIDKALEDAAQADWWYQNEKQYYDYDSQCETEITDDE
jgi:2,4-dienoyl-CoA reductase-like NADH-dependent reductase (Old Yellow Enzyme family)